MWIQLGNDLVNLATALRVERDGPELIVRVPDRQLRALEPTLADDVEDYLRATDGWIELRGIGEGDGRKATHVNLATTTSIQRVDGEYRMYAGDEEYASVSVADAGALESAIAGQPLSRRAPAAAAAARDRGPESAAPDPR
jgi:hypothetical protein